MKETPDADESESIVHINEHELDKECVRLPSQYRQAAWNAAELNRDIDEVKSELEVATAEVFMKIRTAEPSKYGLEKYSEGAIKEIAAMDPKTRGLEKKIRDLAYKAALMKALCSALDMKKRSLTNLVELHSAGYHAEVRASERGREALRTLSRSRIAPPQSRETLMKKRKERDTEED